MFADASQRYLKIFIYQHVTKGFDKSMFADASQLSMKVFVCRYFMLYLEQF